MKKESKIQSEIIRMLNRLPETYVIKHHATPYSVNGIPDLIVCHKGMFISMEVKGPDGRTSDMQELQMRKIRSAGGTSVVVRTCDEAREVMEGVMNCGV